MKNTKFTLDKTFLLAVKDKDTSLVNQLITEYHNECLILPVLGYQGGEKCICGRPATRKVRGDKYYCNECADGMFVCDICGDINPFGTFIDGKHYCIPCYKNYRGSRCIHCNYPTEQTYEGELCCKECYDLRYNSCDNCADTFPHEALNKVGEHFYCPACYVEKLTELRKKNCSVCDGTTVIWNYEGNHYCADCGDDKFALCGSCLSTFLAHEVFTVEDYYYCAKCLKGDKAVSILKQHLDELYLLTDKLDSVPRIRKSLNTLYSNCGLSFPRRSYRVKAEWLEKKSRTENVEALSKEEAVQKFKETLGVDNVFKHALEVNVLGG